VRGNITLGQAVATVSETAGGSGNLIFDVGGTGTTFNLHSATSGVARTLTTVAVVNINHSIGEAGGGTGLGLTKAGSAILRLQGTTANTYTGDTTVNVGNLILNKSANVTAIAGNLFIGDGTGTDTVQTNAAGQFSSTTKITLNAAATPVFDLNGNNQSIGSLASANAAASVTLGAATLETGGDNTSTTFAGVISGTGALTKDGTGTFTLTGANTFSGATTVDAGTLEAAAANALGATSGITVNSGGTLLLSNTGTTDRINDAATIDLSGGTIAFNGNVTEGTSPGTGALTLTTNSIIDFLGGDAVINFGASNLASWTGGATLSIYNWGGSTAGGGLDQLLFGSDTTALTAGQLGQISFYSGAGTGFLGAGTFVGSLGEVVPVPEPSAVFVALGLVGLAARREMGRSSRGRRPITAGI
jgi:autotransporter-associated beta strand protein